MNIEDTPFEDWTGKPPGYEICCETFDDEGLPVESKRGAENVHARFQVESFIAHHLTTAYVGEGNPGRYRPYLKLAGEPSEDSEVKSG